ncbi:phage protein [Yersinia pseudotuberculosis]|uniref:Uncharacterized protein n=1 Tax=Yersinia pseudotuberculosis serotype O:3 (strain YPIII) TaxID=502800 RepID=A0A0H3B726_YERPY|nr:phage Tail Collar domain protein [Yersinia pseudotuberculosis YPIII]SQA50330.1 phage protein [Yersinia pseudotuberculosis]
MAWYRSGTVTSEAAQNIVTGTGTQWANNVMGVAPGMALFIPDSAGNTLIYEILAVDSNTQIRINGNIKESVADSSYAIMTTVSNSYSALARETSAQLAMYQQLLQSWQQILTGTGDVTIIAPDGTEVVIPSFNSVDRGEYLLSVKWHMSRTYIPEGWAPADGIILDRALWPDAWDAIQVGYSRVTDESWIRDPILRGCFSIGNGSTTFRIPDLNGKSEGSLGAAFLRGDGKNSFGEIGRIQGDAIRNITGDFGSLGGQINNAYGIVIGSKNGVFVGHGENGRPTSANIGQPALGSEFVAFDASRVVPTAADNRPVNATGCYIIKLAGSALNEGQINALELATQITQLASRTTVLESDSITTSKVMNTPWISPTLINGWVKPATRRCAYRRVLGLVFVEMTVNSGAYDSTVFTLPPGYRPAMETNSFVAFGQGSSGISPRVYVDLNGNVISRNSDANATIGIEVSFCFSPVMA